MEAAFGKNAGSPRKKPATVKSVTEVNNLFVDDLIGTGGNEIELLHCTECTDAHKDRYINCQVGHSSNVDDSSQRGMTVFLAESRDRQGMECRVEV